MEICLSWLKDKLIDEKELEMAKQPDLEEVKAFGLEPIYLSYFVPWDSHHNYQIAKKWGFRTLEREHIREGTLENYNQIDSLGYLINQFLKYPKFGHASATEMASRWIRSGLKTREEMIPLVEERDGILDKEVFNKFCEFTNMSTQEFWSTLGKWYNQDLFEQDKNGIWHPKFKVGKGLVK